MKMLIGLLALSLSLSTLANSGESKTVTFDGSQDLFELTLRGEQTRTEIRVEEVRSTCYRDELIGYRTICSPGMGPGHFPGGFYDPRFPRPYPGHYPGPYPYPRNCWREPVYRSVAYSCVRTVRTPVEIKEFDVEARVRVAVQNVYATVPNEKISLSLKGDKLNIIAQGSKKFMIMLRNKELSSSVSGNQKMIDAAYELELVDADELKNVAMTSISLQDGKLRVDLSGVLSTQNMGMALKVVRTRALGSDTVLLDRELTSSEVTLTTERTDTRAEVGLDKLVELGRGRYSISARVYPKGQVLNALDFRSLEASRTLIYSIR
jgi:hypothetical protein